MHIVVIKFFSYHLRIRFRASTYAALTASYVMHVPAPPLYGFLQYKKLFSLLLCFQYKAICRYHMLTRYTSCGLVTVCYCLIIKLLKGECTTQWVKGNENILPVVLSAVDYETQFRQHGARKLQAKENIRLQQKNFF